MPRTRRPKARGTRNPSGIQSGVSWATIPSGVTFDQYGFVTDSTTIAQTELDLLDGLAAFPIGNAVVNKLCVSGVSYWSGTSVHLVTGLTTLDQLVTTLISEGGATHSIYIVTEESLEGYVTAALNYSPNGAGSSICTLAVAPGCSIAFIAFGS